MGSPSAEAIVTHGKPPLFERIAEMAAELSIRYADQVGLVVGATHPELALRLQVVAPGLPWLVPGVGTQGGSPKEFRSRLGARQEAWINVSRGVLFAESPGEAAAFWKAAIGLWDGD